ncbi:type II secretion system protein J [Patescibacteria group bacterium]
MKKNSGFSLIEIMVVIVAFALMSILVSQVIIFSLRGTAKSESSVRIRNELNHTVSIMTKNLRNAESIEGGSCFNADDTTRKKVDFKYLDSSDTVQDGSYECVTDGGQIYVKSYDGSYLTGDKTSLTDCFIRCEENDNNTPDSVSVELMAEDTELTGGRGGIITVETKILLRNYE